MPSKGKLGSEVGGVKVGDFTEENLGADGNDFGSHRGWSAGRNKGRIQGVSIAYGVGGVGGWNKVLSDIASGIMQL